VDPSSYRGTRWPWALPLVRLKTYAFMASINWKWSALTLSLSCIWIRHLSKVGSFPSVRMGGSGSLVGFPNPEAGVNARDSIRSRRSEKASRTVASLSRFRDAGTRAGESQVVSWALSCSISAVTASRSS
jgi:hypothetical protein